MLAVERFDLRKRKAPSEAALAPQSQQGSPPDNSRALEAILKRSRQRIQQKHHTMKLLQQPQPLPQQRQGKDQQQRQIIQNIDKILETDEEKKRRKLLAKNEKKERKNKLRELELEVESPPLGDDAGHEITGSQPHENEEEEEHEEEEEDLDQDEDEEEREGMEVMEKDLKIDIQQQLSSSAPSDAPVSYLPFSLPNKDQKPNEALAKAQSPAIPPAISIKEKVTVKESVRKWGVDEQLANDIFSDGIEEFFPVQVAVIPLLLSHAIYQPFAPPRDMIVSAPTGSGKTLAYALPIIQSLSLAQRLTNDSNPAQRRRLHALIILPSRELVTQVSPFFSHCAVITHSLSSIGLSNILSSCSQHFSSHWSSLWSY
jgi:ATP-dependent RNA helicase DDX51/DBP6